MMQSGGRSGAPAARGWRGRLAALKVETLALALAARDPRTPWYAKAVAALVVAYAFSPIDLIPDFIPVLGLLDDLLLIPLGVLLCRTGHPAEAVNNFIRAINVQPTATAYHNLAMAQVYTVLQLSSLRLDRLGHYSPMHFLHPPARELVETFQRELDAIEATINERDAGRLLSYPFLKPSQIPQSIHI